MGKTKKSLITVKNPLSSNPRSLKSYIYIYAKTMLLNLRPSNRLSTSIFKSSSRRLYSKTTTEFKLFESNDLNNLIVDLQTILKDIKTKDQVDIKTTLNLLRFYKSDESQWAKFALRDPQRAYTRNLVTKLSDSSNLLILVWEPGKQSKIHDHPESNCFVKVLKGTIHEQIYTNHDNNNVASDLVLKRSTEVPAGVVSYITDNIGLHRMVNKTKEVAITLHLYVPYYKHCTIYQDGQRLSGTDLGFHSVGGKVIK